MKRVNYPNILLIGGAARNVGKTTFSTSVIKHFSRFHSIIGLKVKTIRPGDERYHGKRSKLSNSNFLIREESFLSEEDTGKMFSAGAKRVFYIKTKQQAIFEAIQTLFNEIGQEHLIVCESNSLREFINPALFLLIRSKTGEEHPKHHALKLEQLADRIIWSDGQQFDFLPEHITIIDNKWELLHRNQ